MEILGILAFVVALLFSVMVHEFGHYITARKFGMRISEFFLGFGRRIWSTQRGETEFGIKAIPAGGYCKIIGMTPDEPLSADEKPRTFVAVAFIQLNPALGVVAHTIAVVGVGVCKAVPLFVLSSADDVALLLARKLIAYLVVSHAAADKRGLAFVVVGCR